MSSTPISTYGFNKLTPLYAPDRIVSIPVALKPSTTYPLGAVVGEVAATPGTYGLYASGNGDGTQNPTGFLMYACTTDASGNVTSYGDFNLTQATMAMALPQNIVLRVQDTPGLDSNAITKLGGVVISGTAANGIVSYG